MSENATSTKLEISSADAAAAGAEKPEGQNLSDDVKLASREVSLPPLPDPLSLDAAIIAAGKPQSATADLPDAPELYYPPYSVAELSQKKSSVEPKASETNASAFSEQGIPDDQAVTEYSPEVTVPFSNFHPPTNVNVPFQMYPNLPACHYLADGYGSFEYVPNVPVSMMGLPENASAVVSDVPPGEPKWNVASTPFHAAFVAPLITSGVAGFAVPMPSQVPSSGLPLTLNGSYEMMPFPGGVPVINGLPIFYPSPTPSPGIIPPISSPGVISPLPFKV